MMKKRPFSWVSDPRPVPSMKIETLLRGSPVDWSVTTPVTFPVWAAAGTAESRNAAVAIPSTAGIADVIRFMIASLSQQKTGSALSGVPALESAPPRRWYRGRLCDVRCGYLW